MFNHRPPVYVDKLKQRRVKNKRCYETPEGKLYTSVTTVTGILSKDSIAQWRIDIGEDLADYQTISAAIIGTELHKIVETYLSNDKLTKFKNLIPLAHFRNFKSELDKIDNIHTLEARVYSNEYALAGTVDCIAEYDGVLSVIDFKTTKKEKKVEWLENYFVQATAYRECWLERTKEKIDQIVILMTGLDGSVKVYKRDPNDYIQKLKETIILYEESIPTDD